jgi:hypothetical protein
MQTQAGSGNDLINAEIAEIRRDPQRGGWNISRQSMPLREWVNVFYPMGSWGLEIALA